MMLIIIVTVVIVIVVIVVFIVVIIMIKGTPHIKKNVFFRAWSELPLPRSTPPFLGNARKKTFFYRRCSLTLHDLWKSSNVLGFPQLFSQAVSQAQQHYHTHPTPQIFFV